MHGLALDQDGVGQIASGLMFGEYALHQLCARQTQVLDFHAGIFFLESLFERNELGRVKARVHEDLSFFPRTLVKSRVGKRR
jgi:hypothetical protein